MSQMKKQEIQCQIQPTPESPKGLCGLANLGNTCFINSCLQILSNTPKLNNILESVSNKKIKINQKIDSILLLEWNHLRKMMERENGTITPKRLVNAIQQVARRKNMDLFTQYSQNDLPEFFVFLIDCFHNAISREINMEVNGSVESELDKLAIKCYETIKTNYSKEYSEVWKLFYGIQVTQLSSAINPEKVLSIIPEPYLMLNLPIPKKKSASVSIYECIDLYVEAETLDGENGIYNEETKEKEAVEKVIAFWSLPDILVMDIKRFNHTNSKNNILVDFPIDNLDLSGYVIGYNRSSYVYNLYGVCNHMGGVNGGHYTCFVKNDKGKWYHYDDDVVTEVKDMKNIVTRNAYCFFYAKA